LKKQFKLLFLALLLSACTVKPTTDVSKAVHAVVDQMTVPTSLISQVAHAALRAARSDQEDVTGCVTTGDISTFTHTCTFSDPGTTVSCAGTSYVWTSGTLTLSANRPEPNLYTVIADAAASVSGGDLEGTKVVACRFAADYTFDSATGFLKTNPVIDNCSGFSCTVGDEEITCEELQGAIGGSPCTAVTD